MTTPESEYDAVEAVDTDIPEAVDADTETADTETVDTETETVNDAGVVEDYAAEVEIAPAEIPAVFSDRPIQTVGRRKEAVVRVRLMPGSGNFRLNGKSLEQYFPNKLHQQLIREPLVTVEKTERFDIFANLHGGGTSGQAGALRLAIARALIEADSEDRPPLKKAGFLTRDPRVIERKKYGLKKARKAPQYSKR
ncbi:30S ribosomal protein S9 [Pseudonocardia aurantiaca]|uniref:Small ribosomal subunit protein uS9 n=1 Tax=Pseudonocardia aurantiaca TaxID=75290 RepID=A0ABW4FE04_9PSEU